MFSLSPFSKNRNSRSGFTLIELAIVLGVVGVLSAGLWKLMSTGTQQTKDQTVAQQQQALISAVTGFLADAGGQAILQALGSGGHQPITLPGPGTNTSLTNCQNYYGGPGVPAAALCKYLPSGFDQNTSNAYGQTYSIEALKDGTGPGTVPQTYSFMIATYGAVIPDADGGRISGLIGGDGGFVYSNSVCTTLPTLPSSTACGSMGSWSLPTSTYFTTGAPTSGAIASRTFIAAGLNGSNLWLARSVVPGDTSFYTYNTMLTNLLMGGSSGTNIYMYPWAAGAPSPGGTNSIHIFNGALYIEGCNDAGITCPATGGAGADGKGSIQLVTAHSEINIGTGFISGNGSGSGSAQIELSYLGSTGPILYPTESLIQLTQGCTAEATSGASYSFSGPTGCPAALNITYGDISVSGGIIVAKKVYSTSDARLKTNIRPIENPLTNLMKIDPVAFSYKNGGSDSMGVTAQNLEKTYPQLVLTKDGTKYVDYSGLIGPLIGAVQELKLENDALQEELAAQKIREERLEILVNKKNVAAP